jgi:hypothetical protein
MDRTVNHVRTTTGIALDLSHTRALFYRSLDDWRAGDVDCDRQVWTERRDRVLGAYTEIWATDVVLSPDDAAEMCRVLRGEVAPDDATLPRQAMETFDYVTEIRGRDRLDDVIGELFAVIDRAAEREAAVPDGSTYDSPEAYHTAMERKRSDAKAEAEFLYQAFLDGEPLDTDDLLVLQRSGLL